VFEETIFLSINSLLSWSYGVPFSSLAGAFCMSLFKDIQNAYVTKQICVQDRLEAHVARRDPKLPMILPETKQIFWTSVSSTTVL